MSIKSDRWITEKAQAGMITPFTASQIKFNQHGAPALSHGLSSYGYDIRCTNHFKIFSSLTASLYPDGVVDPKNHIEPWLIDEVIGDHCVIPPNSFMLTSSFEYVHVPDNVLVVCLGKSTYARVGVVANTTPLEPGWRGNITLEFSNTTPYPVKFYANEGCVQLLFLESDEQCMITYADRKGKYQDQTGIVLPRL